MKLRNSLRFWSMLISGVTMIVMAEWMIVLKLNNAAYKPSPLLIVCVWFLFAIFLTSGFKKSPAKKK